MAKQFRTQLGTSLLLISLFVTACTKTRDAKLPDDVAEGTYEISLFKDVADVQNSGFSIKMSDTMKRLEFSEQSRASNEKTIIAVDADELQVPERIRFMFNDLAISSQAGQTYNIAFTLDNKSVTAFKVVENADDLSLLEKNIAVSRAEIVLQKKIIMSRGKSTQQLFNELEKAKNSRTGALFVPIFKYDVKAFGILERTKDALGEETSTLRLRPTEWTQATHIQLSTTSSDRKLVGVDPNSQDELSRVFVADKINNKILAYGDLQAQLDIGLNLAPKTRVLTLLDSNNMKVYEVTQLSKAKLTDAQKGILRTNAENGQIAHCSAEVKKALPAEEQSDCILIQRFNVPISYVRPELQVADYNGNRSNTLQFKEIGTGEKNTGLVKIAKGVVPEEIQATDNLDPRRTLRIADIKNKEFFFRRTLEDVSAMGNLSGGMSGTLQIVKFSLEDDRLVIKKTQAAVTFKKTGTMEDEEVMSLPVSYIKRESKDASGKTLAAPRFVKTNKDEAEYAVISWINNSIPVVNSPLAFYGQASCFANVNNMQVVDTDMRLSEGVLNFSYLYSVTVRAEEGCLNSFYASGDYDLGGNFGHQLVQKVRERISFKVNDGSTDKTVAPTTPFNAQNALNYGVFTMGFINPSEHGSYGKEGQQINYPAIHDFTNGKKYLYTVGGMPTESQDAHRRNLLKKIASEVVADWNVALHKAFAGTALARSGNYLEVQFSGEDGIDAHLGDLDKNIIWFVDRPMANGLLGVSQAGINPRSGMLTADSLIVYNGNNAQSVEHFRKYYQTLKTFRTGLEKYKQETLANLKKSQAEQGSSEPQTGSLAPAVGNEMTQRLLTQLRTATKISSRAGGFTPILAKKPRALLGKTGINRDALKARSKAFKVNSTDERYYIDRIFKKALELNLGTDPSGMQSLTAKEILATYGNRLTLQQKNLLKQKAGLMDMHARMQKYFISNPGCAMRVADVADQGTYDKFLEMSFDEAFIDSTKATLAHELGHSMGLTHNFVGSYDKANFKFEGESTNRNYSSIMDYINDTLQNYAGLGPYDVYAIRAAYTGLLEVRPEARNEAILKRNGLDGKLVNNRFVHIDDIKKSFAPNGWANFTGGKAKSLVMQFQYCTDKDLQYNPTCRQFDFGTTPVEIVKNAIQQYENSYITSRYGYDNLSFDWVDNSNTISRTLSTMFHMRQFFDEAFYRLVTGQDQPKNPDESPWDSEHFQAAIESYKFFLGIIATPDTNKDFFDYSRFIPTAYTRYLPDGKTEQAITFVESRSQSTVNATQDRIQVIGNEVDKLLAMQMLTLKGIGYYKYDQMSLNVSYVDYESYSGNMGPNGLSPITSTFAAILTDNLSGLKYLDDGVALSSQKITPTSSMIGYAALNAILSLESDAIDQRSNFANLFKIGTSVGAAPKDRLALNPVGTASNSSAAVSYWALDNANVATQIMSIANSKYVFLALAEPLKPTFAKMTKALAGLFVASQAKEAEAAESAQKMLGEANAELVKQLLDANKDGALLSKEELAANPEMALEKQARYILEMNMNLVTITNALLEAKTDQEKKAAQEAAGKFIEMTEQLGEVLPLIGTAQQATKAGLKAAVQERTDQLRARDPAKDGELILLTTAANIADQIYTAGSKTEAEYSMILNNIKFLSSLTRMTNPEYTR